MLAAPLIAGNDVRNMSAETREILTNREVIAIDQDRLGMQGFRALSEDGLEMWLKPLAGDDWAVCFLNRSDKVKQIEFDWKKPYLKDDFFKRELNANKTVYRIRDLWAKKDLGTTETVFKSSVGSHDAVMLRLSK
jgi:alpha-galactosidase